MNNPLVSISCITFNQSKFVRECFDGFLMQQTNFSFEVIVHDDASTDGTKAIIEEYTQKYPELFFPLYQTENQYSKGVRGMMVKFNFPRCRGKYIALCEGDDYWTDPYKLQKQVDFLEANEEYVIHSGKAQILRNSELMEIIGNPLNKETYEVRDFLTKNNLVTCTIMFRNKVDYKKSFKNLIFGDWMLYVLLLTQNNNLAYVSDKVYSVYRIHDGGVMQNFKDSYKNDLAHLKQILAVKKHINITYSKDDLKTINLYCLNIFKHRYVNHKYIDCFKVFFQNFILVGFRVPFRMYLSFIKHNRI